MLRTIVDVLLVFFFIGILPSPPRVLAQGADDERQLRDIQQRLASAWLERDRDFIESVLAPEWSVTQPDGQLLTRATVLGPFFDGLKLETSVIDDVSVTLFGTTAVVRGRTVVSGTVNGTPASARIRFTDVFIKRSGRWRAVASHSSPLIADAGAPVSARRMPDGKEWTAANLIAETGPSYCYEGSEQNCRRYGRLYTWDGARRGCESLGNGWRLPTNQDWQALAKHYGGVRDDSKDTGHAAYQALLTGGSSGFDARLGGNRSHEGHYARLEAHGFYWTASESDPGRAWFYNFGKGSSSLNRHRDGEKRVALSVRCVRD